MSTIVVEKPSKGLAFASATWHFSTERLPEEARGDLFARRAHLLPAASTRRAVGPASPSPTASASNRATRSRSSCRSGRKHAAEYVHLRDPRGAGFEPETLHSQYKWDLGISWYEEIRDSGTNFFFEWLPAGEYTFKYRLRATMAGTFKVAPAVAAVDVRPRVHRLLRGQPTGGRDRLTVAVNRRAGRTMAL